MDKGRQGAVGHGIQLAVNLIPVALLVEFDFCSVVQAYFILPLIDLCIDDSGIGERLLDK